MLNMHFKIKYYTAKDADGVEHNYRDLIKLEQPNKGRSYTQVEVFKVQGQRLWAFANTLDLPAERYLNAAAYVQLATVQHTQKDLLGAFTHAKKMLEQDADKALAFLERCELVVQLTDENLKWLNLSYVFLMFDGENPLFFEPTHKKQKESLFLLMDKTIKKQVSEFAHDQFARLMEQLFQRCPECFDDVRSKQNFFEVLESFGQIEVDLSLCLRQLSKGDAIARDLMMQYPIGDLYSDMRIMIIEAAKLQAARTTK